MKTLFLVLLIALLFVPSMAQAAKPGFVSVDGTVNVYRVNSTVFMVDQISLDSGSYISSSPYTSGGQVYYQVCSSNACSQSRGGQIIGWARVGTNPGDVILK